MELAKDFNYACFQIGNDRSLDMKNKLHGFLRLQGTKSEHCMKTEN
jgi:hypothetical protein